MKQALRITARKLAETTLSIHKAQIEAEVERYRGKMKKDFGRPIRTKVSGSRANWLRELTAMIMQRYGLKEWQAESAIIAYAIRLVLKAA